MKFLTKVWKNNSNKLYKLKERLDIADRNIVNYVPEMNMDIFDSVKQIYLNYIDLFLPIKIFFWFKYFLFQLSYHTFQYININYRNFVCNGFAIYAVQINGDNKFKYVSRSFIFIFIFLTEKKNISIVKE